MGIFDKAKDALSEHSDKVDRVVDGVVDKVAEHADQRTGNQHGDKIDQGAAAAKEKLAAYRAEDNPPA